MKIKKHLVVFYKNRFVKLIKRKQISIIRYSGLFNPEYYLKNNPDVVDFGLDPILHFIERGGFEGRNPSVEFDVNFYMKTNPDVLKERINPLIHYILIGRSEGKKILPENTLKKSDQIGDFKQDYYKRRYEEDLKIIKESGLFVEDYYMKTYPDVQNSNLSALEHFFLYGGKEGRNPSKNFDTQFYVKSNPKILEDKVNPLLHYILIGKAKRLQVLSDNPNKILQKEHHTIKEKHEKEIKIIIESELFDEEYYLKTNSDVQNSSLSAIEHFYLYGGFEGRNPSKNFDTKFYTESNPDVLKDKVNPLLHYILIGKEKGLQISYNDSKNSFEKNNRHINKIAEKEIKIIRESGLFDKNYYLKTYTDVQNSSLSAIEHFYFYGSKEGRNPNVDFNTREYVKLYKTLQNTNINPLIHFILKKEILTSYRFINENVKNEVFEKAKPLKFLNNNSTLKYIAFYLPQFHPIPENDKWWGMGFTEWDNVVRAKPQFNGHYQPHLPIDLGFYDLRIPDVMSKQIEMAKSFGIKAFCFYYYWFDGKRLLDKPLDMFLEHKEWDFEFCVCWANENWSRRWNGSDDDILIAQNHSEEDDLKFIKDYSKYTRDNRYIRINDKPILIIYRPDIIPNIKESVKRWKRYYFETYKEELLFAMVQTFGNFNPEEYGLDYAIEFPPHNIFTTDLTEKYLVSENFSGKINDAFDLIKESRDKLGKLDYKLFRGVMLNWDNTARMNNEAYIYRNVEPENYKDWLFEASTDTTINKSNPDEHLVFINAWNEWAEGTHLEPDEKYGYSYLNSTGQVLSEIESAKSFLYNQDKLLDHQLSKDVNDPAIDKPKILIVSYNYPRPDISSGELRFFMLLKLLTRFWEIDFCIVDSHVDALKKSDYSKYKFMLKQMGINLLPLRIKCFDNAIEKYNYAGIYFNFYWVAEQVIDKIEGKNRPFIITDSVDIHFAREFSQAAFGQISYSQAFQTKKKELSVYKASDVTIVVSDEDSSLLETNNIVDNVIKIPNIIPQYERIKGERKPIVVFIGNYSWPPNPDAVIWFVSDIWPDIYSECPDAEFFIIGSEPTKEVVKLGDVPGVKVLGFVNETKPYLDMAAVSVAPLRFGGGMKGKVNEAMSFGVPVVSTKYGAQGFDVVSGKEMIIADSAAEFAKSVVMLLKNRVLQEEIGMSGKRFNAKICSPTAILKRITELVEVTNTISRNKNDQNINENLFEIVEFKQYINPLVSIIIPVHNQWDYTYQCLRSIKQTIEDIPVEIIIIDDVSTDETININNYIRNIKVIRNNVNQGFLLNCNKASKIATGQFLIFLNNDTVVSKSWLQWLIKTFDYDQMIGLVGSKLIFETGDLQEAGGIVFSDGSAMNYGRESNPFLPEFNYLKDVDYCSGASLCVRIDLWKRIGGFDLRYSPAYYEDTDLAFQIRKLGYRTIYQPKSEVIHYEGISHGKDLNSGIKKKQNENKDIFFKKWSEVLKEENFSRDENVFRSRERSKQKDLILLIVNTIDIEESDALMMQILEIINKTKVSLKIYSFEKDYEDSVIDYWQQKGIELLFYSFVELNDWINANTNNIDEVYFQNIEIEELSKTKILTLFECKLSTDILIKDAL